MLLRREKSVGFIEAVSGGGEKEACLGERAFSMKKASECEINLIP